MKTLLSLLFILLSSLLNSIHAQNLTAYLYSGDTSMVYKGIVNEIAFDVLDLQNPCKRPKLVYASGTDVKVAWKNKDMNILSVLSDKDIFYIKVYVELNKELFDAGTLVFKTTPIPNPIGPDFRAFFPVIKRTLVDESFDTKGRNIKPGRFEASMMRVSVSASFPPMKANLVSVNLIDTLKKCEAVSEVVLESDEAKIEKISRKIFSVMPNEGVKICNVKIYAMVNKKKIYLRTEILRVRK